MQLKISSFPECFHECIAIEEDLNFEELESCVHSEIRQKVPYKAMSPPPEVDLK